MIRKCLSEGFCPTLMTAVVRSGAAERHLANMADHVPRCFSFHRNVGKIILGRSIRMKPSVTLCKTFMLRTERCQREHSLLMLKSS